MLRFLRVFFVLLLVSIPFLLSAQENRISGDIKTGKVSYVNSSNIYKVEIDKARDIVYLIRNADSRSRISLRAQGNLVQDLKNYNGKTIEVEGEAVMKGDFDGIIVVRRIVREVTISNPQPGNVVNIVTVTNVVFITNIVNIRPRDELAGLLIFAGPQDIYLVSVMPDGSQALYLLYGNIDQDARRLHGKTVRVTGMRNGSRGDNMIFQVDDGSLRTK